MCKCSENKGGCAGNCGSVQTGCPTGRCQADGVCSDCANAPTAEAAKLALGTLVHDDDVPAYARYAEQLVAESGGALRARLGIPSDGDTVVISSNPDRELDLSFLNLLHVCDSAIAPEHRYVTDWQMPPEPVRALGIIDGQNDFGSATHGDGAGNSAQLPVPGGEEIAPVVAALQQHGRYNLQFASKDWHPEDMFNFASQNPGKEPGKDMVPDADGEPAMVYPDHCRRDTWGAALLPGILAERIHVTFLKGTRRDKDSYSVCGNQFCVRVLKALGVTHIDLVGLVFRICVGLSAIDLAKAGFKVRVITDGTRDLDIEAFAPVIQQMKDLGVEFVTSDEVLAA